MSKIDLRKEARGRECQVRLPGVCNFNPETTVLAHIRMSGISGMGIKAPNILGAWCCAACHSVADRQQKTDLDPDFVRMCFYEGVFRTIAKLIEEGKV
jgi:hypothetical protein